jgi:glycosyltransferase involved in cell wall biosynthesis
MCKINKIITIATPSFNQGEFLSRTIESIWSQEGGFYIQHIIADGGSTDNSVDVLYNLPEYCNNETGRKTKFDLRNAKKGGLYKELLRGWCPAITSCSMIRRRVLENTSNRFDENLTSYQDYDFWLTLAKNNHKFNYLPDYLTINHHHFQDQVSINIENRLNGLNKFFAKWQDEIKKELGNKELNYVYRKKEETVYFNYIVKEISKIYYQKTGGISKVFLLFNKNFILSIWKYFLVKMMRISRL